MQRGNKKDEPPTFDGMWAAMRRMKNFTVGDIIDATGIKMHSAYHYARQLKEAGYIARLTCRGGRDLLVLVKDIGVVRPEFKRDGTPAETSVYDKMWASLKVLKTFDPRDLSLAANTTTSLATRYCDALLNAGYLMYERGAMRFRFLSSKDTGPRAPRPSKGKVFDRNLGKLIPEEAGA